MGTKEHGRVRTGRILRMRVIILFFIRDHNVNYLTIVSYICKSSFNYQFYFMYSLKKIHEYFKALYMVR
jgi:hypothetical protein